MGFKFKPPKIKPPKIIKQAKTALKKAVPPVPKLHIKKPNFPPLPKNLDRKIGNVCKNPITKSLVAAGGLYFGIPPAATMGVLDASGSLIKGENPDLSALTGMIPADSPVGYYSDQVEQVYSSSVYDGQQDFFNQTDPVLNQTQSLFNSNLIAPHSGGYTNQTNKQNKQTNKSKSFIEQILEMFGF